jgi:hypothetical protein
MNEITTQQQKGSVMNETIIHTQFSIYNNFSEAVPMAQVGLEELHGLFLHGNKNVAGVRQFTELYISTGNKLFKNKANDFKSNLPCFTPGGLFGTHRRDDQILKYSGVVQVDVDLKVAGGSELAVKCKAEICKLPFVSLCAISPSGVGVKALVMSNNVDITHHKELVYQVCEIIERTIAPIVGDVLPMSKIVDRCGKALSQPLYLTEDKEAFLNLSYVPFEFNHVDGWSENPAKVKRVAKAGSVIRTVKVAGVSGRDVATQKRAINTFVAKMKARPKTATHDGGFAHRTADAVALIFFANRIGCDEEVVRDWMINDNWDDARDLERVAEMYRTYAADHGVGYEKEVEVQAIIDDRADEDCVWVPAGGYLSDVIDGRKIERSTHIVAPTGSGKTHLQFDGPQIWVFPTTALCNQFVISSNVSADGAKVLKNAWTVYGDAPCPEGSRELIITTYDSFERVAKSVDVRDYTVVLDEVHNFITASKEDYKLVALRNTLGWLPRCKKVITLTATPFPHCISTFADYDTIVAKKKDSFKRTVKLLSSEESRRADVVKRIVERDNFALVFLQNTERSALIPWEKEFASMGKKVVFINSRNKGSKEFGEIVRRQQVDEGCVYVSTSVIAEGVSIQTELDVVDVYILAAEHPFMIEQMSRRFRQIKELNVFILTDGNGVGDLTVEDLEVAAAERREQMGKLAGGMVEAFEASGLALDDANISGAPAYEDANGMWRVDELLIENNIFQNECGLLKGNKQLVMELLNRKYGYEVVEEVEKMNESAKAWYVDATPSEVVEMAKNVAIGRLFGGRFDVPNDEMFADALRKHSRFVSKIVAGLPGITKLGQVKMKQIFDAYDVWDNTRSARFITYVRLLNSGSDVRHQFRQLVLKYCVGVPLSPEKLNGYGSILFDHETLSASDRKKSEFMASVLMAHDKNKSTERTVKQVPKINSVVSGDVVEVVGVDVEEVRSKTDVYTYTPNPELMTFESELMALNIFGYENTKLSVGRPVVLSDDVQFKNEVMSIPGFTF